MVGVYVVTGCFSNLMLYTAYDVLSDKEKKAKYDQYGEDGLGQTGDGGDNDAFDIFSQFFGGGRRRRQQEPSRGPDVVMPLRVSLADLHKGKSLQFSIRREVATRMEMHCCGSRGWVLMFFCFGMAICVDSRQFVIIVMAKEQLTRKTFTCARSVVVKV